MKNYILNIYKTPAFLALALVTFLEFTTELFQEISLKNATSLIVFALTLMAHFLYLSEVRSEFGLEKLKPLEALKLGGQYLFSIFKVVLLALVIAAIASFFYSSEIKSFLLSGEFKPTGMFESVTIVIVTLITNTVFIWMNLIFIERRTKGSLIRALKITTKYFKSFAILFLAAISISILNYYLTKLTPSNTVRSAAMILKYLVQVSWILGATWYTFKTLLAVPEIAESTSSPQT